VAYVFIITSLAFDVGYREQIYARARLEKEIILSDA
jgi:hypothetical protein